MGLIETWYECENESCNQFHKYYFSYGKYITCPCCGSRAKRIFFPPLTRRDWLF